MHINVEDNLAFPLGSTIIVLPTKAAIADERLPTGR